MNQTRTLISVHIACRGEGVMNQTRTLISVHIECCGEGVMNKTPNVIYGLKNLGCSL